MLIFVGLVLIFFFLKRGKIREKLKQDSYALAWCVARGCTCVFEHLDMVKISKNGPKHVSHGPLLHLTALHLLIFLFSNDY